MIRSALVGLCPVDLASAGTNRKRHQSHVSKRLFQHGGERTSNIVARKNHLVCGCLNLINRRKLKSSKRMFWHDTSLCSSLFPLLRFFFRLFSHLPFSGVCLIIVTNDVERKGKNQVLCLFCFKSNFSSLLPAYLFDYYCPVFALY